MQKEIAPVFTEADFEVFRKLCEPVAEYIREKWDLHCTVVITDCYAKVVRDEVGMPFETPLGY